MKKTLLIGLILTGFSVLFAQHDTTFYYKEHKIVISNVDDGIKVEVSDSQLDSAERLLFEGTFDKEYSSEVSANFSFQKLIPSKKKKKRLYPHDGGFSIGFTNLSTKDLDIGNVSDAQLKYSSFELAFQLGNVAVPIASRYGWLFFTGVGFRYQQFNSDFNTAFRIVDHYTQQLPKEGTKYKMSKLATWYLSVPFMIEWQKKIGRKSIYCQFGVETGILLYSKSKVKYMNEMGKKVKENYGRGMNINPITADARVGIGISHFGLYARYGLLNLFRKNRGAEVIPVAMGFVYNF